MLKWTQRRRLWFEHNDYFWLRLRRLKTFAVFSQTAEMKTLPRWPQSLTRSQKVSNYVPNILISLKCLYWELTYVKKSCQPHIVLSILASKTAYTHHPVHPEQENKKTQSSLSNDWTHLFSKQVTWSESLPARKQPHDLVCSYDSWPAVGHKHSRWCRCKQIASSYPSKDYSWFLC